MNAPIAVSVASDATLLPGGEVLAAVTVSSPADVVVELVREERWRRKMENLSQPSSSDDFLTLVADTAVVASSDLTTELEESERSTEDTAELGAVTGRAEARLRVPRDASPSAPPHVRWLVVATVVGAGEDMASAEAEVAIVTSPETVQPGEERVGHGGDVDEISVRWTGTRPARAGETLHGVVVLSPKKGRSFTDVRVQVAWTRNDCHGALENRGIVNEKIAEGVQVTAGNRTEVAFSVDVPADLPPSYATDRNSSRYTIWATGALRMRKDIESWQQVRIASAAG